MNEHNPEPAGSAALPAYHFFSGKGGVGKTTLAAATAVHLARSGLRVLISSTDPAHSLSDVFDAEIGHEGADIEPGLHALEIDSTARWKEATADVERPGAPPRRRGRVERALADAAHMLGEAPGVDEFVSLELLLETMASDAFDAVVFDTAPTGHALRMLFLPEMLDGWLGRLLSVGRSLNRIGRAIGKLFPRRGGEPVPDFGENLSLAKEGVASARELITDPRRTLFALVTIPEAMSVLETRRAMEQLIMHHVPLGVLIANQVQPASETCRHCMLRRQIHQRELGRLEALCGRVPMRVVESKPTVIRGPEALAELGKELWGDGDG